MRVDDFDYELPEELIAQKPLKERDACRLMVLDRSTGSIEHKKFSDILDYLNPGDLLVMNDSRVIPARIFGVKLETGAKIEFLLTKRLGERHGAKFESGPARRLKDTTGDDWQVMARPGKRLHPGDRVYFGDGELIAEVLGDGEDGTKIVRFHYEGIFMEILERLGAMPLPPYIDRPATEEDREDYQTVYNRYDGSVAAPTAGLHFTEELLEKAKTKGVKLVYLTLHVGIGTFRPVKADTVEEHNMHFEEYVIPEETAKAINETIEAGGRIISVGTTSARTLESAAIHHRITPGAGNTNIFIYPGYEFKIIDGLITNFHLPKSTLIMLVSALYDREHILEAYQTAVKEKYRFFSYGDAMLII